MAKKDKKAGKAVLGIGLSKTSNSEYGQLTWREKRIRGGDKGPRSLIIILAILIFMLIMLMSGFSRVKITIEPEKDIISGY